ncbi:MAG: MFS transporter, partial [Candidatus Heimdallarchaeota archaeon]
MNGNIIEKIDVEEKNEIGGTKGTRLLLYLIAGLSSSAVFISRVFIGLYAAFIDSSALAISFIVSLRNLIQQVFQFTFGRISDRIGRKIVMLIGIIIAGVSIALFPLIKNGWVLVGGVVGFSIGFSMYYPSFTAIQGDITNKKNRAGLISLITIIGAFATL